ncbi:PREDICTED: uncharacterized protein LOC108565039 isoform X2 [Nicrophorus vespilloides]|uniref:Uncharacterized protein LOC108565039 isoform X2 n=1 Tax=Nicrophorus vespilloides TaxID=110193 RepID=A0ABM1MYY0_NICVS|nr:PREDICTED: uncharacterized protein LOC108565039 isoform X2 [Nicrophorus vespilloides]
MIKTKLETNDTLMVDKSNIIMSKSKSVIDDIQKANNIFCEETVNLAKNLLETIERPDEETIKQIIKEIVEVVKVTSQQAMKEKQPEINDTLMIEKPDVNLSKSKPVIDDKQKINNFRKEAVNLAKNLPETIKILDSKQESIKQIIKEKVEVTKATSHQATIERQPEMKKLDVNIIKSKPVIDDKQKTDSNFRKEAVHFTTNLPKTIERSDDKQVTIKEIIKEKVEVAKPTSQEATIERKPIIHHTLMVEKPNVNTSKSKPVIDDKQKTNSNFRKEAVNIAKNLSETIKRSDGKEESIKQIKIENNDFPKAILHKEMIKTKPELQDTLIIEKPDTNMSKSKVVKDGKQKTNSNFRKEAINLAQNLSETIKKTDGKEETIQQIIKEKVEFDKTTSHNAAIERKLEINDNLLFEKPVNKQKIVVNFPKETANVAINSKPMKRSVSKEKITKKIRKEMVDVGTSLQRNMQDKEKSSITCLPTPAVVDEQKNIYNNSLMPMIVDKEESIKKVTKEIANSTTYISSQQTIKTKPTESEGMTSTNVPKLMVIDAKNLPHPIINTADKQENKLLITDIAKELCRQGKKPVVDTPPPMIDDKQQSVKLMKTERIDVANDTVSQLKTNIPTQVIVNKQGYFSKETSNTSNDTLKPTLKTGDLQQTISKLSMEIEKQETSKIVNKNITKEIIAETEGVINNKPKEARDVSLQSISLVCEKHKDIKEMSKESVDAADLNNKLTGSMIDNSQETIKNETLLENEDIMLERQMNLQSDRLKLKNRNECFKSIYLSQFDLQMIDEKNGNNRKNESNSQSVGEGNANFRNANIISEEMKNEQGSTAESLVNRNSINDCELIELADDSELNMVPFDGWFTENAHDFDTNTHKLRTSSNSSRDNRNLGAKSTNPSIKINNRRESMESTAEIDTDDLQNYNDYHQNKSRYSIYPKQMPHLTNQKHKRNRGLYKKGSKYGNYDSSRQRQSRRLPISIKNKTRGKRYSPNRLQFFDKHESPSTSYQNDQYSNPLLNITKVRNNRVSSTPVSSDSCNEKFSDLDSDKTPPMRQENVQHDYTEFSDDNINPLYKGNERMDNNFEKSNWFPEQKRRTFSSVLSYQSDKHRLSQSFGDQRDRYQEKPRVVHHTSDFKRTSLKKDETNFNNEVLDYDRTPSSPPPRELAYESNRFCIKQGNESDVMVTNIKRASEYIQKTLSPYTATAYSNSPTHQVNKINVLGNFKFNDTLKNSPKKASNAINPAINTLIKEEISATEPSIEVNTIHEIDSMILQPTLIEVENINKADNSAIKSEIVQDSAINITNNDNEVTTSHSKHVNVRKRKDIIKTSLIMSEIIQQEDSISNNTFDNKQSDENKLMDEVVCNIIENKDIFADNAIVETTEYSVNSGIVESESYIQNVHENLVSLESNIITKSDEVVSNEIVDTNLLQPFTNVERQDFQSENKDREISQINESGKETVNDDYNEENNWVESTKYEKTEKEISGQVKSYETMYPKIMEILSGPIIAENLETQIDLSEERAFQTIETILPMNSTSGNTETEIPRVIETEIKQSTEHKVIDKLKQNSVSEIQENESEILPVEVPEIIEERFYKETVNTAQLNMMEDVANKSEDEMITINKFEIPVTEDFKEKEGTIPKEMSIPYSTIFEQSYHTISDCINDKLKAQSEDSSGSLTISLTESISLEDTSNDDMLFDDTDEKQNEQVLHESISDVTGMHAIENIIEKISENPEDEKMNDIPQYTEDVRLQEEICETEKEIIKESKIIVGSKVSKENVDLRHLDKNVSSSDLAECNIESKSKSNDKNVVATSNNDVADNSKINECDFFADDDSMESAIPSHKINKRKKTSGKRKNSKALKTLDVAAKKKIDSFKLAQINQIDTGLLTECSDEANLDKECITKTVAAPIAELFDEESLDSLKSTPKLQIDTSNDDSSNDQFLIKYVEPPAKKSTTKKNLVHYDEDRSLAIDQHVWKDLEDAIYIEMMPEGEKRTSTRAAKTKAKARISTVKLREFDDLLKILEDKSSQSVEKKETRGRKKVLKEEKAVAIPKPKSASTLKSKALATPKSKATTAPKSKAVAAPKSKAATTPKSKAATTSKPKVEATPKPKVEAAPKPKAATTPKPKAATTPKPKAATHRNQNSNNTETKSGNNTKT